MAPVVMGEVPGDVVSLGDFESGLSGWSTNGKVSLGRVTRSDSVPAVEHGDHALEVDGPSDPGPMISRDVDEADFVDHPYLLASVYVPEIPSRSDSVTFELRYRYDRSGKNGKRGKGSGKGNGNGKGRGNGKPVEVLDSVEVPQQYNMQLFWDFSSLAKAKRSAPNRLEIGWYRTGSPPKNGFHGTGPGDGFGGVVYFDQIALTDDKQAVRRGALGRHLSMLRAKHGHPTYEFDSFDDGAESGRFVYTDGTEIQVTTERRAEDKLVYAIGDSAFKLGGGWQ